MSLDTRSGINMGKQRDFGDDRQSSILTHKSLYICIYLFATQVCSRSLFVKT